MSAEALHASAPVGCRCADCQMDGEACPTCYAAWWGKRHPNTLQIGGFDASPAPSDAAVQPDFATWLDGSPADAPTMTRRDILTERELFWCEAAFRAALAAAPGARQPLSEWQPTAENVNALPEPIRKYVADLETLCDPAGIVRENAQLKDTNRGLQAMYRAAVDATARMLTPDEVYSRRQWVGENDGNADDFANAIQRKFAEVNGITLAPIAGKGDGK